VKRPIAVLALAAGFAVTVPAFAQAVKSWKDIPDRPLRDFKPAVPQRIELANGMLVFLQEDHELPLVSGVLWVRGGSREEPAEKAGLTALYGQAWRTGGTVTRDGDALDELLEARAAKVETGAATDHTSLSWDCLKENLDEVFSVVAELLQKPAFRQEKLDLARRQIETDIARRNDDPNDIAIREARKIAYGADSPYARVAEYATVGAVTRDDLVAWHRRTVHPNNIVLGIVGDFDARAMRARLERAFGSWARGPVVAPLKYEIEGPKGGVFLAEKDDVNQSTVYILGLGIRRDNPDFYAVEVMNQVLSGGFAGRLVQNVRTRKGLAYWVGGAVISAYDRPGLFYAGLATKSESTVAATQALYEEIDNLRREAPTAEEIARAKESLLNSFVFQVDSPAEVLVQRLTSAYYGYPLDLLEKFRPGIEAVSAADVLRVSRQYIQRERLAALVVGHSKDFDKPLSTLGTVTSLDIHIPPPPDRPGGQP
jgi:zinc protease